MEKKLIDIQNILISRLRFMGDIILTTPLIRAIGEAFPNAKLCYLAETPYPVLLENNPFLHEIIPFDFKKIQQLDRWPQIKAHRQFLIKLRKRHFDLAIDLFGNPRSALQTWFTGARYRIGGNFRGRGRLYNIRVDYSGMKLNAIQFHLQVLKPLGIPIPEKPRTEIYTTPAEDQNARQLLNTAGIDLDQPIIGIHPGATWPAKMWLLERFIQLIQKIQQWGKAQIVLTHGPGEEERLKSILTALNLPVFAPPVLPLRELAAVLKQFSVYVSNDCGPLHLAVAVKTKTLGIFGPGEPDIWFPYYIEDGHHYIHKKMNCWPCHRDFCDQLDCMKAITVDEVFGKIQEMLNLHS